MIDVHSRCNMKHIRTSVSSFLALAIVTTLASSGCHSPKPTMKMPLKLYYVPIGAQTLVPVMPSEMEQKGRFCAIDSARAVVKIERILARSLTSGPEAFVDPSTRVKVMDGDRSLIAYVDNYGGIRFANGRVAKTKNDDLYGLKRLIESRCGF